MCIAAYVPANVSISEETLRECFRSNPDGAGIMYSDGYNVFINKGYMKADEFVEAFMKIPEDLDRSFHCRIATSGMVGEGCTHPFPIIEDMKDMKKTKHVCQGGIAHNGVITWATPTKGRAEWYSDTMNFTSLIIAPMLDKIHNSAFHELIERSTTGNKFIIMTPEKVHLIGSFQQEGGIFYSNNSFRKAITTYNDYSDCGYGNFHSNRRGSENGSSKTTRKAKGVNKAIDKELSNAIWIMIETKDEGKLDLIANSLVLQGINVIEEDEALFNGESVYLFLVDKLPTYQVYGYKYKVVAKKGEIE